MNGSIDADLGESVSDFIVAVSRLLCKRAGENEHIRAVHVE